MSHINQNVARFELLMDAGFGAQKVGDILIRAFAKTGKYVYIEPLIPAEISPPARTRPALSGVIIRVGSFKLTNIGNMTDFIIAQHEIVLDRRLDDDEHNPNCRVLLDMGDKKNNEDSYEKVCKRLADNGLSVYPFEICAEAADALKVLGGKGKNMYYLGIAAQMYSMPEEAIINEINLMFAKKLSPEILAKNIEVFHLGYAFADKEVHFSYDIESKADKSGDKILIDGNTAMSLGIVEAGFKLMSGYPITPASSILHTLAKIFPAHGGLVHQAEDEISAMGTAIGAYYGGVPAITASSGPGISLKQEFIGYAAAAEIPAVIIDVQRSGPSTGMPTKTEQSDLIAAIYGCHGDNTKIVISVCNVIDCFFAPQFARYIAEKLRLPVYIMSDFQTANSYTVLDIPKISEMDDPNKISDEVLERFYINRLPDDIQMVRTKQDDPGTPGGMRRVTGLNTDEHGAVNYFAKSNERSHAIRNEKIHHVRRALKMPKLFGNLEKGDLLVVGWGSTSGAIKEAVEVCQKEGLSVDGLCFKVIYPLPLKITEVFSRFKKVVTVELAYGDANKRTPLAMFLRTKTLNDIQPMICRATGRPISPATIQNQIKEVLSELNK